MGAGVDGGSLASGERVSAGICTALAVAVVETAAWIWEEEEGRGGQEEGSPMRGAARAAEGLRFHGLEDEGEEEVRGAWRDEGEEGEGDGVEAMAIARVFLILFSPSFSCYLVSRH